MFYTYLFFARRKNTFIYVCSQKKLPNREEKYETLAACNNIVTPVLKTISYNIITGRHLAVSSLNIDPFHFLAL